MRSATRTRAVCLAALWALVAAMPAAADERAGPAEASRTVVLDTTGFWRLYHTLSPPVIQLDDGLKPVLISQWLDRPTPLPPRDWTAVEFDDSTWLRGPARINCRTPYVARLAMRGYFTVTDPAKVDGLALSLGYQGGVLVRVNGREVGRADLPKGPLGHDALARPYPREAFVNDKGKLLVDWDCYQRKPTDDDTRRLALRERSIESLPIPRECLRRGLNVLAVEIIRAPYDKAVEEKKDAKVARKGCVYDLAFNTCELLRIQLSAVGPGGLVSEAVRPHGFQVWNSDVLATDFDLDFAGPSEPLRPVRMVGVRGGIFSAKVVAGSDAPIEGLKAAMSDLAAGNKATIPASAVRVRYGIPWGHEDGVWGAAYTYNDMKFTRYPRKPSVLGALAEAPLEVVPVRTKTPDPEGDLATPGQPEPVFGAVVPVWITVSVPRDARPGDYSGSLTLRAKGAEAIEVPVELKVIDWTLPEPERWKAWTEIIQAPDTTAVEYGVPLWSERHWQMIAHSMDLIGETSSRVLYVPLICQTNLGNAESMVRWIEKAGGGYDFDFAVMERYLDTAEKHMGRPHLVVFQVWDNYLMQDAKLRPSSSHDQEMRALRHLRGLKATLGTGPVVTVVKPATQETENVIMPQYDDPQSEALWRPLFAELLSRMKHRGLEGSLLLGFMTDAWPNPEESRLLDRVSGGLPWVSVSHMGVPSWRLHDVAEVAYQATAVMNRYANDDPPTGSHYGWKQEKLLVEYARGNNYQNCPGGRLRHTAEFNVTGHQRGAVRIGADFWDAVKNPAGNRVGRIADRYPQSCWRNLDLFSSLLGPGPDGPVATWRFEAFREGLQECEARILIEQALTDDALKARIGAPLAQRCQDALLERTHYMLKSLGQMKLTGPQHWYVTVDYTYWHRAPGPVGHQWFIGSGWQKRSELIYSLAAEVTRRLREH